MKELTDPVPFDWDPLPPPSYYGEMEFYHCRSRRSYRMRTPQAGPVDDLLRSGCVCEVQLLKRAHYLRRNAPFLSVEYVKSGTLLVRQRERAWELGAGEVFLMQPGIESEFLSGSAGCCKISVMITGTLLHAYLAESGLGSLDVLPRTESNRVERLLQDLGELADEPAGDAAGRNAQLTFELLQALRIARDARELPPVLAELCAKIDANPELHWTLPELAGLCNCSGAHLVRLFRRYLDTTPRQYLLTLRMGIARQLLAEDSLSVKEIAARIGYDNALNFSTEFRKRFGISPREFRRNLAFFG